MLALATSDCGLLSYAINVRDDLLNFTMHMWLQGCGLNTKQSNYINVPECFPVPLVWLYRYVPKVHCPKYYGHTISGPLRSLPNNPQVASFGLHFPMQLMSWKSENQL